VAAPLHRVEAGDETAMAEVLRSFDTPVTDGTIEYLARAVGRVADDGMWEGWLEFLPITDGADPIVGAIESRQPEREHLAYWASGLTTVFLEGAFDRARRPVTVRVRAVELPYSSAPEPRTVAVSRVMPPAPEPVLDPFEIGSRNLDLLRQELHALNRPRLLNIITAFDLNPAGEDIAWMTDHQLAHFIVVAVEARLAQRVR
jgi:hypothetical protein